MEVHVFSFYDSKHIQNIAMSVLSYNVQLSFLYFSSVSRDKNGFQSFFKAHIYVYNYTIFLYRLIQLLLFRGEKQ